MHGPPLTPRETAAVIAGAVGRLERLGIDHGQAVRAVAADNGWSVEAVRHAVSVSQHGAAERVAEPNHA
jgi:hypothetical protein